MHEITSFSGKYAFLSNFYAVPLVTKEGLTANSVEHAYQASKATNGTDRLKVLMAPSATAAKRCGASITRRPDWEKIKDDVMLYYVRAKFHNSNLRLLLVATDDARLIEGNTWGDRYWGAIWTPQGWHGENKLGQILMKVRRECGGYETPR